MKKILLIAAISAAFMGCTKQEDPLRNSVASEMSNQSAKVGPSTILTGITGSLTLVRERNDNNRSFKYSLKGLASNSSYYLLPITGGVVPQASNLYPFGSCKVISSSRGTASGTIVFTSSFDNDPNSPTYSCSPLCFESMRLVYAGVTGDPSERPVSEFRYPNTIIWSNESYLDIIEVANPGCNDRLPIYGGTLNCLTFSNQVTTPTGIKLTRRV